MKLRLLPLLLVCAATAAQAEDCPLVLNQAFRLHYNQWQVGDYQPTSTTQAIYEVNLGLPVFTYRLGALSFNGTVEHNRLNIGGESDSSTGVSRYGARLSLFPYRPFRLHLDYQHTQSPDLFQFGQVKGDTWGAGINFNSRILQDIRIDYRHGTSRLEQDRDDWSLWKLEANQRFGSTQLNLQTTRQEYLVNGGEPIWRMDIANLDTESHFGRAWVLRTRSQLQDTLTTRWFEVSATFYGPVGGNWHTLTTVASGAALSQGVRTATSFASESILMRSGSWCTHLTGAVNDVDTPRLGLGSSGASVMLGSTYSLNRDWCLHGEVGLTGLRQTFDFKDSHHRTTTTNLGLARGGDIPDLIRHSLFFLSDWSYDRRMREEYPPDYVPSELAQDMLRRRMAQSGTFGFAADWWRMTNGEGPGKVDWARVSGQLQTRSQLNFMVLADYKRDAGLTEPGVDARNANLIANGAYQAGNTTLSASVGYNRAYRQLTPDAPLVSAPILLGPFRKGLGRHYSLGLTTRLWKVPVGILALRYQPEPTRPVTTVSTWADLSFRQVSFRVRYEMSRLENGVRSNHLTVDLMRWFDTLCSRSWR